MARSLPGYEDRPAQRRMLAAVATALNLGDTLLVEAGTGTGKSLAYLLPALRFSVENGLRVVVSTNTINLQDQLLEKDVPDLLRATGLPARVSVLKGRANYLCMRRWLTLFKAEDLGPGERMLLIRTLLWLRPDGDRRPRRAAPLAGGGRGLEQGRGGGRGLLAAPLLVPPRGKLLRGAGAAGGGRRARGDREPLAAALRRGDREPGVAGVQAPGHRRGPPPGGRGDRPAEPPDHRSARSPGGWTELAEPGTAGAGGLLAEATGALVHVAPDDQKKEDHRRTLERGREQVVRVRSGLDRLFAMLGTFARDQVAARRRRAGDGPGDERRACAAALV